MFCLNVIACSLLLSLSLSLWSVTMPHGLCLSLSLSLVLFYFFPFIPFRSKIITKKASLLCCVNRLASVKCKIFAFEKKKTEKTVSKYKNKEDKTKKKKKGEERWQSQAFISFISFISFVIRCCVVVLSPNGHFWVSFPGDGCQFSPLCLTEHHDWVMMRSQWRRTRRRNTSQQFCFFLLGLNPSLFPQRVHTQRMSVGEEAPDFALPDEEGRQVSLSSMKGNCVVLFFYPGDFTPVCTKEGELNLYNSVDPLQINHLTYNLTTTAL